MAAERSRSATGFLRITAIALLPAFIASCTSSADPAFGTLSLTQADTNSTTTAAATDDTESGQIASAEGDIALPETVAYLPSVKPGTPLTALDQQLDTGKPAQAQAEESATATQQAPQGTASADSTTGAQKPAATDTGFVMTATDPTETAYPAAQPKKRGFLASLFGATPAQAAPAPRTARKAETIVTAAEPAKPLVQLASVEPSKPLVDTAAYAREDLDPLPGVRQTALFEIKRKSGIDDDSDVDLHEEDDAGSYQVASAAGLARLAPNGLLKQTDEVDVACLKPSLVRVLKQVEARYGKKMIVTSGYRNPDRNRRARGAKNSLHMYCAAADVQVPGVSKWELAKFVRDMPGRGGVGTYCHTESVHIDVGPERDWNWRCRRRRG